MHLKRGMAERAGFEPAVHLSAYTRLAGEHLRPTRSPLRDPAFGGIPITFNFQLQIFRPWRNTNRYMLIVTGKMCPANFLAEGVGFEPTSPFGETVFKTAAIDHSAIPPRSRLRRDTVNP
jgi:hypothetical protein